jgi:hypothetical protein
MIENCIVHLLSSLKIMDMEEPSVLESNFPSTDIAFNTPILNCMNYTPILNCMTSTIIRKKIMITTII